MSAGRAHEHPPADAPARLDSKRDADSARPPASAPAYDDARRDRTSRPASRSSTDHVVARRSRRAPDTHADRDRDRDRDRLSDRLSDRDYDRYYSRRSGSDMRRSLGYHRRPSPPRHDERPRGSRYADRGSDAVAPAHHYPQPRGHRDGSRQSLRRDSYNRPYRKRSRSRSPSPPRHSYKRPRQDYPSAEYRGGSRPRSRLRSPTRRSSTPARPADGLHPRQNGFGNTRDESLFGGRYAERRRSSSRAPYPHPHPPAPEPPAPPSSSPPPPPPPPPLPQQLQLQPQPDDHQPPRPAAAPRDSRVASRAHSQTPPPPPRHGRSVADSAAPHPPVATSTSTGGGGIGTPMTPTTPKTRSPADGIQLYSRICMVGEGTYGKVYKARNRDTSQVVALKRMRIDMDREGFPITAMREIRLLKLLQHPNITQVLDVVPESSNSVYVVMEYMDYDLSGLISHPLWCPDPAHKKSLMLQLLQGLDFMHTRGILHRDIKGSNLLVNHKGQIKYVDFGLARSFHHTRMHEFTNRVITLWYRPPELLLGTTVYGPEVDIWSLGCVILELFLKKPAFQGQNDIDQLEQIFKMLGTPSPHVWDSFKKLPWACYMTPNTRYEECLSSTLSSKMTAGAVNLITWMLSLSPSARPSASECLAHNHFIEEPAPVPPTSFPVNGDWHEYESKLERRKRKQAAKSQPQRTTTTATNN